MMDYIYILRSKNIARPWFQADKRLSTAPDEKLFTECCACNIRADECEAQISIADIPLGGVGDYQEKLFDWETAGFQYPYDDPSLIIRCGEGFGCNANPKKKFGATLRMSSHYGL